MEKILKILEGIKPGVDYANETALIDDGFLDSFNVISIVLELNETFGIQITVSDLEPENFNSVKAICELVDRLKSNPT